LPPLGSKIQKWAEKQQTWEEKENQEIHETAFKGANNIPPLLQVGIQGEGNHHQVGSTQN
jgi:hypothetical protein